MLHLPLIIKILINLDYLKTAGGFMSRGMEYFGPVLEAKVLRDYKQSKDHYLCNCVYAQLLIYC